MTAQSYDVIVAGGGCAGAAAAIASARTGARTLLLERHGCLGGAAAVRNVLTLCGLYTLGEAPQMVVGGIGAEVVDRLRGMGAITPPQRFRGVFAVFEPEAMKRAWDDLTIGAGVDVRFGSFVTGAARQGDRLASVTFADHGGQTTCTARAFVDCTGEGDLAAFGGAGTRYGNDGAVNLGTLGTRFGGIPKDRVVTAPEISEAIAAQGFPTGTVTKDRCVVVRLPVSGDMVLYLASADYDPRDGLSLSRAEADTRRQAWAYLDAIRSLPGCGDAYLVSSGPEIGTRESRHLLCRQSLRWSEIEARREHDDCIGLGAWGAEWHDRASYASSFDYPPDKASYQIPFACLHSADTPNLFCAGRLADGDRRAGAAIRVMGTAMVTGQAAGSAAAMLADGPLSVPDLQRVLRRDGAFLHASDVPG